MTDSTTRRGLLGAGLAVAATMSVAACSSPAQKGSGAPATVKVSDVPVGKGIALDSGYLVSQPTAGTFKAFSNVCTHAGCPIKEIRSDSFFCGCHGSRFSVADGSVVQGPADRPLDAVPVTRSGDTLTVGKS